MEESEKLRDTTGSISITTLDCYCNTQYFVLDYNFMDSSKPSFLQEVLQNLPFVFRFSVEAYSWDGVASSAYVSAVVKRNKLESMVQ